MLDLVSRPTRDTQTILKTPRVHYCRLGIDQNPSLVHHHFHAGFRASKRCRAEKGRGRKGDNPLSMPLPYRRVLQQESSIDWGEASSLRILFLNLSTLASLVNGHKWPKALRRPAPYRGKPLMFSGEFTKQTNCTEEENGRHCR